MFRRLVMAALAAAIGAIAVQSVPDVKRYLKMRDM